MRSPLLVGISLLCPFLLAAGVETRNDIVYSRASGEALAMDAHIPDGPGPFAAVILVHGGGWLNGTKQAARTGEVRKYSAVCYFNDLR